MYDHVSGADLKSRYFIKVKSMQRPGTEAIRIRI